MSIGSESTSEHEIASRINALVSEIGSLNPSSTTNIIRRKLYSIAEIIRLDIEETFEKDPSISISGNIAILDELIPKLRLVPAKPKFQVWQPIDSCFRFVSACACFFTFGVFVSLPIIVFRPLAPNFIEKVRQGVSWTILLVLGISTDVVGLDSDKKYFEESCALLTFSHASNIDGFLVSGTCPIRHYALAKKELFIVPFFAWISLAIGGVPVDRNNRDRAVRALQRSAEAAKNSKICIVIAPEGTRSTTGQLLPFKKGFVHMWDELRCPIVPVVSYGAFDLFPARSWINTTGKVVVEYLKPIYPSEAENKDQMLRLVRRRMLEALLKCPSQITRPLTWKERIATIGGGVAMISLDVAIVVAGRSLFFDVLGLSTGVTVGIICGGVAAVTVGLYVYSVYLVGGSGSSRGSKGSKGSSRGQEDSPGSRGGEGDVDGSKKNL